MRFSIALTVVASSIFHQATGQNITNNGIGSTPADRHYISDVQAASVIAAAYKNATAIGVPQNIAVVDPSGLLVAFLRMDNAFPGSIDISQKKARTSVLFNGIPSGALLNRSYSGGDLYGIQETNGGVVVFGGGVPIYANGFLIGGVGVSGGSVEQDVEVATAGAEAIGSSPEALREIVCAS